MNRKEVYDMLIGWGWKPSTFYVILAGQYFIDLEGYDKLRGFMVRETDKMSCSLWVSEGDLSTNFAVKFFLQEIANK